MDHGPVRIGVLGCGRIGRLHAELLARRVAGATLVAVQDVVPSAAAALGADLAVPALDTPADVLAAGVDAVAVCTTTDTHVELIIQAAAAGVAVFCEKPIDLDLAAIDRALAAVDTAGTLLHVGFNRRFDPGHASVREAVATGALGPLSLVRITSRDPAPPPIAYIERSGGLFLDMTIHDLDMARFVTGSEVVEVFADGAVRVDPAIGEVGDIDTAVVHLRHADGCRTVIDNSRSCAYGYDQRVEAFGALGMAESGNTPAHGGLHYDGTGSHRPPIAHFFVERYVPSYLRQWEAFVDAVVTGGPPPVSGADGRAPVVLGLAAGRSLAERRPVLVEDVLHASMITIVNGGTEGLGEAVARKLAAGGATGLVLAGRSSELGSALAAELTDLGTPAIFVAADITDVDAPQAVVAACAGRFGTVHGLVNVAALTTRATLFSDTPEHFDRMMAGNVRAPYFLIQAAARLMLDTGAQGSIVNVGSTSGYGGQTKLSAYAISKGALAVMTRNLAYGLMRHGIRVNQVNPGWMETASEHRTQIEQDGAPPNWLELAAPTRPFGRLVQPWEVANAIAFCLSPDSGLMTGNVIDVDQTVQGAGDPPLPGADETVSP